MVTGALPRLLVLTDRRQAAEAGRTLAATVAEAVRGGARAVVLREKDLPAAERRALLAELVALGARFGATVTVHGDVDAARATGAAGVHLPRDGDPEAARAALGRAALIGVSAHDEAEIAAAWRAGADYATLSPIFPSASKPGLGASLALEGFSAAVRTTSLPLLALSGVTPETAGDALSTGAAGLAVMGAAMRAEDPGAMIARLIEAIDRAAAGLPGRPGPG